MVGVEQATNSVSLVDFEFPKRAALLLGRPLSLPYYYWSCLFECLFVIGAEKEGIPVELIQQLDICVEIPQFGRIRSLNVHVSGALCIYEYTKIHLAKS